MNSDKKYVINLFGYSCSGKTTVADMLAERIHGLYTVDFDKIKKQLSGYHWKNDGQTMRRLEQGVLDATIDVGLPVLALFPFPVDESESTARFTYAKSQGYEVIHVRMTAPESVLIARYQERMSVWRPKHKPKTLDEYIENIRTPYFVPENTQVYDSSVKVPDTIVGEILTSLTDTM